MPCTALGCVGLTERLDVVRPWVKTLGPRRAMGVRADVENGRWCDVIVGLRAMRTCLKCEVVRGMNDYNKIEPRPLVAQAECRTGATNGRGFVVRQEPHPPGL